MSKSFSFDEQVAKELGVEEAILIRSFQFWIDLNKTNGTNKREGRTWTYNTYQSIAENFPFWNGDKVRRILEKLCKEGVLLKTNKYNRFKADNTNWFAFNDEAKWVKVKEASEIPLANLPDENSLFNQTDSKAVNDAGGYENGSNSHLAKMPDRKVNSINDQQNQSGESAQVSGKSARPEGGTASPDLAKMPDLDVANLPEQYQLLNNSLQNAEADKTKSIVNIDELFHYGIKPIECYFDGTADKLAFDFNNADLVEKKILQLFRIYLSKPNPHDSHVNSIRKELLNDIRPELTRKMCWVCINIAFYEYPGEKKNYQNENALLRKIGWKKNDFAQALPAAKKEYETAVARKAGKQSEKKRNDDDLNKMAEWIAKTIDEYKNTLSQAEINEVNKLLKAGRIMSADGQLKIFLYDVHGVKEEVAA